MTGPRPSATDMKPTLIITVRNESFKKKFGQEIQRYDYVKRLGVEIKMVLEDNAGKSKRKDILPRWAASSQPGTSHADTKFPLRLIASQREHVFGNNSACGLRWKFVVDVEGSETTRYSTLGGLIRIGDSFYRLTTGHTIVISGTENYGADQVGSQLAFQDSNGIVTADSRSCRHVSCHPTFVSDGQRFRTNDLRSHVSDDKHMSSDWLLVNVDDKSLTENTYEDPTGHRETVTETLALAQLNAGPVSVVAAWHRAQRGYLSQNSSILHTGRSAFRVKQVVMDESVGRFDTLSCCNLLTDAGKGSDRQARGLSEALNYTVISLLLRKALQKLTCFPLTSSSATLLPSPVVNLCNLYPKAKFRPLPITQDPRE